MSKSLAAAACAALLASHLFAQAPCYESSLGTNLGLTDETVSPPQPLGFTFMWNGSPVTAIGVNSNGYVWLDSSTASDWTPTEAELLSQGPRICPLWTDLNPAIGGGVYFNSFPAGPGGPARAVVTWDHVPTYANHAVVVTVQLQILSDGSFQWIADGTATQPGAALVGFSQGGGATSFPVDFSAPPHNTGNFPTVHETFAAATNDLLGRAFLAAPNATNGCLVVALSQCRLASATVYGSGCPARAGTAAYEVFGNGTFDLSNGSLLFLPSGSSYLVIAGTNTWFTGLSNNLSLGDDVTTAVTLPFPFPHAGGLASTISVCSNGYVWLGSNTSADLSATSTEFLTDPMGRIAALWMDLNPNVGGGVYADLDSATGDFVITWSQVPEYSTSNIIDMQLALQPSGIFELRYHTMTNLNRVALTGYSTGTVLTDPGMSDFSTLPIVTGTAATPLQLEPQAGALPQVGTTFVAAVSSLPAGAPLAVVMVGLRQASLDLTSFGMPGCTAYVDFLTPGFSTPVFLPVLGPVATLSMNIPNSPNIIGLNVYTQALTLAPGFNPLGLIASNGLALGIGN